MASNLDVRTQESEEVSAGPEAEGTCWKGGDK